MDVLRLIRSIILGSTLMRLRGCNCCEVFPLNGGSHETHNRHRHCDRRSWPRSLWIDSRSKGNPDPRADRNARADSITRSRAAVADSLVAS